MFYPGSRIRIRPLLHPGSQIRGVKKHRIPDPTFFCIKAINKFCLLIPDPTIAPSRIRGVKKHRIRIRNTAYRKDYFCRIKVTITGQQQARFNSSPTEESIRGGGQHLIQDSLENIMEEKEATTTSSASASSLQFHENRGRNVLLTCCNTLARRSHSYNQGRA
jgi:hypothetical protein